MTFLENPLWFYEIFACASVAPLWIVFRRAGFSPWLCLAVFVPTLGIIACAGFLALRRWPAAFGEKA